MKKVLNDSLKLGLFSAMLLLFSFCGSESDNHEEHAKTQYTCPMHPQIVTDAPGTCPICHMDLVPVERGQGHAGADTSLGNLVRPANEVVFSSVRTVKPAEGARASSIRLQGVINYDTNNWNSISSRVGGRIERLYVEYNYQFVRKGQKLMDIYSPDLAAAQQELIYLRNSGDNELFEAAKKKLRLLGASNQQIAATLNTGKVDYTFSVYSSYSGYVVEQNSITANAPGSSAGATVITADGGSSSMNGMGASAAPNPGSTPTVPKASELQVREGQYVSAGQKIFNIINADVVWVEFFAGPEQLKYLKKGTEIQVSAVDNPDQKSFTKVSLIQPYYSDGTTFPLLRGRIENPRSKWKAGQLANVKTDAASSFGTWLPRTAVLQTGTRFVAFVKMTGSFVPKYVTVSQRRGDWVNIGNSLSKDADVAVNAWFMVDSESFVKVDSLKL